MVQLVPVVVLALFSGMAAAGDTPPAGSVISSDAADGPSRALPATPAGSEFKCVTCAAAAAHGVRSPVDPTPVWREGPERRRVMRP